ncbi:hypothetical protein BH10BAC2_BH10BAC2_25250 [soil metagenome]
MVTPGRSYTAGTSYRYGFNGKENDNEVKGTANQQDYGMRIYDPRLGKFLSVDPITSYYPELTPYQFASNRPIDGIDLDGLEYAPSMMHDKNGNWVPDPDPNHSTMAPPMSKEGALGLVVTADIFLTRGWLTRLYMGSVFAGAFEHNRAATPEGRVAQDQRSREALANTAIAAGGGEILGVGARSLKMLATEAKSILNTSYSYGEVSISTQVGKEALQIGSGGIGPGGYLELEIDVKVGANGSRVASGETVFEEIYKTAQANANTSINGIRGIWTYGDNLSSFNKLITDKVNKGLMTYEEAALQTFTGKMATKKGFTKVESIAGEKNGDGTYKAVTSIIFTK